MTQQDAQYLRDLTGILWNSQAWRLRVNIEHRFEKGASPELYSPEDLNELCLDFHKPLPAPERVQRYQWSGQSGSSPAIVECECSMAAAFL
jgi:hypothetical protein